MEGRSSGRTRQKDGQAEGRSGRRTVRQDGLEKGRSSRRTVRQVCHAEGRSGRFVMQKDGGPCRTVWRQDSKVGTISRKTVG